MFTIALENVGNTRNNVICFAKLELLNADLFDQIFQLEEYNQLYDENRFQRMQLKDGGFLTTQY